jgi:hypothetical protein
MPLIVACDCQARVCVRETTRLSRWYWTGQVGVDYDKAYIDKGVRIIAERVESGRWSKADAPVLLCRSVYDEVRSSA